MTLPKIVAWNCKGVGSLNVLRHLLFLIKCNNSDILILVETHVDSRYVSHILEKTHFTHFMAAEAIAFSGGIWVIWDDSKLHVELFPLMISLSPHLFRCQILSLGY